MVHEVEGIERIRFLTSHPNYFSEELMQAVAELPKLMPHIEVPIQAGDDEVLENMKRGYTQRDYRDLVETIRLDHPGLLDRHGYHRGLSRARPTSSSCRPTRLLEGSAAGRRPPGALLQPRGHRCDTPHGRQRLRRGEDGALPHAGGAAGGHRRRDQQKYLGGTVEVLFEEKVQRALEGPHADEQAGLPGVRRGLARNERCRCRSRGRGRGRCRAGRHATAGLVPSL